MPKQAVLKTYLQELLYGLNRLYLRMYIYIRYAYNNNENRDHEFKEEQGRVCERVLRKKRERNVIEYKLQKGKKRIT